MCAQLVSYARCRVPVVKSVTQRGTKIYVERVLLFTWVLRTLPGLPSDLLTPPNQPLPLPERWHDVIDRRYSAKWHVPLFVSLHLGLAAFFFFFSSLPSCCSPYHMIWTCSIQGNGHSTATPQWNEYSYNFLLLQRPCLGSSWIKWRKSMCLNLKVSHEAWLHQKRQFAQMTPY